MGDVEGVWMDIINEYIQVDLHYYGCIIGIYIVLIMVLSKVVL
jgi:hypothetical protein